MARATKSRAKKKKAVPRQEAKPSGIDQRTLTKGQIRKLNALRKSLGEGIADKAFSEWLKAGATQVGAQVDKNAQLIAESLGALVQSGKLRIPRGGYVVTRGRKRVIITRAVP